MPRVSRRSSVAAVLVVLSLGGCRVVDQILPEPLPAAVQAPIIPPRAKFHPVPTRPVFSPAPPEELTQPLTVPTPLLPESVDSGAPTLTAPHLLPEIEPVPPPSRPLEDRTAAFQWDPLPMVPSRPKSVLRRRDDERKSAPSPEERGASAVRFIR